MYGKNIESFESQKICIKVLSRVLIFLLALGLIFIVPGAYADDVYFSSKSIEGEWGFSASGTIVPPALPVATPAAAVGVITFDGGGGCFFSDTINIGGTSGSRTSTTCAYSVDPDGTGTISVLFPGDPGPTPLSFVIVNDMQEIRFIRTDLGVASGVAKRQAVDEYDKGDDDDG